MSTPTRAAIESELVRRWGRHMARVGMDGTTVSGANLDLNIPMRDALQVVGVLTADPMVVADIDCQILTGSILARFRVVAELRLVQQVINLWGEAELSVGRDLDVDPATRQKILDGMLLGLKRRTGELLEEIRKPLRTPNAPFSGTLSSGGPNEYPVPCGPFPPFPFEY
jgi:hypothetical protein